MSKGGGCILHQNAAGFEWKRATAAAECAKTHANVQRERDMGVYACARMRSV